MFKKNADGEYSVVALICFACLMCSSITFPYALLSAISDIYAKTIDNQMDERNIEYSRSQPCKKVE